MTLRVRDRQAGGVRAPRRPGTRGVCIVMALSALAACLDAALACRDADIVAVARVMARGDGSTGGFAPGCSAPTRLPS